jgi:outer membrane protein assembly factor BamE (lipoprotein component of BamABCDE complex)
VKNDTFDLERWYYNHKKFKTCTCNLEKRYHGNYNHENYYHEILKIYTNKFDTMKWAKKFHTCVPKFLYNPSWNLGGNWCCKRSQISFDFLSVL